MEINDCLRLANPTEQLPTPHRSNPRLLLARVQTLCSRRSLQTLFPWIEISYPKEVETYATISPVLVLLRRGL
jgi:hypothetical protein